MLWQSMSFNFLIRRIHPFNAYDRAVAGIIKQVFLYYFKLGGVLVATTNRLPEGNISVDTDLITDLYATDFRRAQFKSFLDILQARCVSFDMRSTHDYRKTHPDEPTGYFLSEQAGWEETCAEVLGKPAEPRTLNVYSRPVKINTVGETGAARFDFSEVCMQNLGPADYLTIASTFPVIIIDNVPILTMLKKNEARRFITLLDALYECRVKLLIRAASTPDNLFFPDADTKAEDDIVWTESYTKAQLDMSTPYRPNISTYTGRNEAEMVVKVPLVDRPVDSSKLTAFTGEDERFAFRRAVSRLYEMPSKRWWENQVHAPIKDLAWAGSTEIEEETSVREEREFLHSASPFRVSQQKPPSFWDGHFWGVMKWGPRAGRWGLGEIHFKSN